MDLVFEKLRETEVDTASELVNRVFLDSVAATMTQEGIYTFQAAMTSDSMLSRLRAGNHIMVCIHAGSMVAVGEIRDHNHLNLLFVESQMQRKGIGRQLFHQLIQGIPSDIITVNSSLNSMAAYQTLGFNVGAEVFELMGIRSQPMIYHKPA